MTLTQLFKTWTLSTIRTSLNLTCLNLRLPLYLDSLAAKR